MENIQNSFNYVDIVLAIPLLWFCFKGFKNGLIIEAASLAALFLGVYGAYRFSGYTTVLLIEKVGLESEYISLISFAITFILIVIAVHFLAKLIDRFIKAVALGFINRLLGLLFGVAKFAFIISIILGLINHFDKEEKVISPKLKQESLLYEPLSKFAPMIFPYLNLEGFEQIEDKAREKIV
ncbi:MAG: CvpA family protein [Bacteroidales bacterium]|nr:CvpA family protein [Bacteroidales bacterium]MCF8455281.1 CvpA family protein [Bacteroidales bacterium]